MKEKYLYNTRTKVWRFIIWFWLFCLLCALSEGGKIYWERALIPLVIFIWRYIANKRKCKTPEIQAELKEKKAAKLEEKRLEAQRRYELKQKNNKSYKRTTITSSNTSNNSGVGKGIATAGLVVGYTGLRTIYKFDKTIYGWKEKK